MNKQIQIRRQSAFPSFQNSHDIFAARTFRKPLRWLGCDGILVLLPVAASPWSFPLVAYTEVFKYRQRRKPRGYKSDDHAGHGTSPSFASLSKNRKIH